MSGDADETGVPQSVEVKRKRVGRNAKSACHFACRHARRARLDEDPIDLKPVFLGKSGQSCYSICLVHDSTIIEAMSLRQAKEKRPAHRHRL